MKETREISRITTVGDVQPRAQINRDTVEDESDLELVECNREHYRKSIQLPVGQREYLGELQQTGEVLSRAEFDDYAAIIAEEWEPGDHVFRTNNYDQ